MDERWQRLKTLIDQALDLPLAERPAFLAESCGDDAELREEATSLLALDVASGDFLATSPVAGLAALEVALPAGTLLGPYRLLSPLGSGGMGDVYLAERADGAFEQQVAVKVLRGRLRDSELRGRFLAERQFLAELRHPNIAQLLDGGTTEDGRPYLVMEHIAGEPIDRFCAARRLGIDERLELFLRVADAVRHAHQHLVVHRDLKPANILITPEGEPKLLDFGIAKDLGDRSKTPATRLLVPLTPEYASPEQLVGGTITTAVDVYALGVILYELLTGASPFGGGEDPLAGRSRTALPPLPSTRLGAPGAASASPRLGRRLRGDLDHILLRALAPDPGARYPTVEELARDLRRHLAGLPLESRGGRLYRLGKWSRRHFKSLAAAALVTALGVGLVGEGMERRQAERQAEQLARENERVEKLSDGLGQYLVDLFGESDAAQTGERSQALVRMLDRGAALLGPEAFAGEPRMRAALLGAIGRAYRQQSRGAEAEPLLRESLELRRGWLPPDHEDIGLSENNQGLLLRELGRYPEALEHLREALRIQRIHFPGDDAETASMLSNLAGIEKELDLLDDSTTHFREALAMKSRLPEVFDAADLALSLKNLGTALREAGDLDGAEATFRQALSDLDQVAGATDLARASIEHHLGSVLRERGNLPRARELLERTLATRLRLRGPGHRQTLETELELALLEQAEGRLEGAEERLRRVLDLRRQQFGPTHPDLAETLLPLARVLTDRGDLDGARRAAAEAVMILYAALPAGHRRTVEAEAALARIRSALPAATP